MERLTQSNFNYCEEYCTDADGCGYAQGKIPTACADAAQYYRLAAYEDTGLEPEEIKYRLEAVTAAVDAALSVINEFAAEMDYCVYSCIYQAVEAIGEEDQPWND